MEFVFQFLEMRRRPNATRLLAVGFSRSNSQLLQTAAQLLNINAMFSGVADMLMLRHVFDIQGIAKLKVWELKTNVASKQSESHRGLRRQRNTGAEHRVLRDQGVVSRNMLVLGQAGKHSRVPRVRSPEGPGSSFKVTKPSEGTLFDGTNARVMKNAALFSLLTIAQWVYQHW